MNKTLISVFFFLLLSLSAIAQDFNIPLPMGEKERAMASFVVGPAMRTVFEGDRSGFFMLGLAVNPIFPGFKTEFGITNDQVNEVMNTFRSMESEGINASFGAVMKKLDEDINYIPTEEEEAEFETLFREMFDKMDAIAVNTFSEEQVKKMDGMMFGLAGGLESPFLNEKHMVALKLTDEQKEKFKAINEDTGPERERIFADLGAEMKQMFRSGKVNFKDLEAVGVKFKEFADDLKKRRSEVLTESQLAMVTELSKPPKFITASPFGMMMPKWMPGPNSWKPGDPLPEGVVPESTPKRTRNRPGFPRGESE